MALIVWLWNKGERSRLGRVINTTIATIICVWAFVVLFCITTLLVAAAFGMYP